MNRDNGAMNSTNSSINTSNDFPVGRGLLAEVSGVVQGHRDGHGFVVRDDGEADIFLPVNEMRAVLHKDHVKVSIVRQDRRGRPEGRVTEILEIGRAHV